MNTEEKDVSKEDQVDGTRVADKQDEVVVDADEEKRSGVKESVRNTDAIVQESEQVSEKDDAVPSFFIKKSARKIVEFDVLTNRSDGDIVSISRVGLGIDFEKDFSALKHTILRFEFSIPNYEDISTYRQRSSVYRRELQQMLVDKLSLRNCLLVWHLKEWNLTDENGDEVELFFDKSGALSEDSISTVYSLSPSLMDVVMTNYEKAIMLT